MAAKSRALCASSSISERREKRSLAAIFEHYAKLTHQWYIEF